MRRRRRNNFGAYVKDRRHSEITFGHSAVMVVLLVFLLSILFPFTVTMAHIKKTAVKLYHPKPCGKKVSLLINGEVTVMDVEEFIPLVLYAILPEEEEPEVQKAMMVMIRTYIGYYDEWQKERQQEKSLLNSETLGLPYTTYGQLEKCWGKQYERRYNRTMQMLRETEQEMIYSEGKPVFPYYHEVSAGVTGSGEAVYLKSVESNQDVGAEDYRRVLYYTADNVLEKLTMLGFEGITPEKIGEVIGLEYQENGKYVKTITVADRTVDGEQWRNVFGIPSMAFTFEPFAEGYKIVSEGIGTGLGVSIYGAEKMAAEGKTYKEILNHYYSGVDIQ